MIVVLAHTHPSITSGGAEISAYTLYRGLLALGVEAAFVAMCPEDALHKAHAKTEHEYLVPFSHAGYDDFYHLGDPLVVDRLLAQIDALSPRTVIFHHFLFFGANAIRRAAEVPGRRVMLVLHEFLAICHHHGQMVTRPAMRLCQAAAPVACSKCFPEHSPERFVVRQSMLQEALAGVSDFISPSHFLKDRFVAWGLPSARLSVIENGVPHLPPPETPGDEDPEAPIVVGFFGQINPFKGVDLLLDTLELLARQDALAQRLQIRVHGPLVGVSPEFAKRFETLVASQPMLDYRGPYQNERVFDLMRECDYVLMASKWWENSPVVIQEAYACGRPLIVPGIGGMAEKISDGVSGLHFEMGDARDLARVLNEACAPGRARQMRQQLPKVSTAEDMAQAYLALISSSPALGSAPSAGATRNVWAAVRGPHALPTQEIRVTP